MPLANNSMNVGGNISQLIDDNDDEMHDMLTQEVNRVIASNTRMIDPELLNKLKSIKL